MYTRNIILGIMWLILLTVTIRSSSAATYTVTNVNDSGEGSLRQAIIDANTNQGFDTIEFNIEGEGPHSIQPDDALPNITDPVLINGYTQPGSQPNTNPVGQGLNTMIQIELNGINLGEGSKGLVITGGGCTIRGLAINYFYEGIHIETNGENLIAGNFIGTDINGTSAPGNSWGGIVIINGSKWNTIGGSAPETRNLISGNGDDGITIDNEGTTNNTIEGNLIGTDIYGTTPLSNQAEGVSFYDGSSTNVVKNNLISSNGTNGIGIRSGCSGNTVIGNFIGTDISGMMQLANAGIGIYVYNSTGNKIGGAESDMRNVVSGNGQEGIWISGIDAHHNWVAGNFIGTDTTGTYGLGNGGWGVAIWDSAWQNYIGTNSDNESDDTEGNIISGNGYNGVVITYHAERNVVAGNYIGTDVSGTVAIPNGVPSNRGGVEIANGARQNRIGTNADGISDGYERNIISGNTGFGVNIFEGQYTGTELNSVAGNYIGTDVTGTLPLPNVEGLSISASRNAVGGSSGASRNIISGNTSGGISLVGSYAIDNSIQGNFIGTDITSLAPLGNGGHGVSVTSGSEESSGNLIGGLSQEEGNVIAYNSQCGVAIVSGTNNEIVANFIHSNGELGIDLNWDEVTPNDTGDVDSGGNDLQNYPVLDVAVNRFVRGSLSSAPNEEFRLEFFSSTECDPTGYGEGQLFLGRMNVVTDQLGQTDFVFISPDSFSCGSYVTATATMGQNTSEFSAAVQMTCECDLAAIHIFASTPVSVGYPTVVQAAVTNLSFQDMILGDGYINILDQWNRNIFEDGPQQMDRLFSYPFLLSPGDTAYAYQYEWHPSDPGMFYVQVFIVSECDTNADNDTVEIGPLLVSGAGRGFISYFDQFSPEREPVSAQPHAGPAVRFSIPENMDQGATIRSILVGMEDHSTAGKRPTTSGDSQSALAGAGATSSFWVYLFAAGPNDSTFGDLLIEPFQASPESIDENGRVVIDLTERPDYGNLAALKGDFWVHLKATEETDFSWVLRPLLLDTGVSRNWYFIWSTPRLDWDKINQGCPPPGWMNPFDKGWEELIGLDFILSEVERGDVNEDGLINVLDVLSVVNHILGIVEITDDPGLWRADCNGDGDINVLDALGVVNVILGISECSP